VKEQDKRLTEKRYEEEKTKGVKFFPDIVYKDTIVAFAIFILMVALAMFVGVPEEPPADPSDSSYVPRPEWYFLFLFEMLKFFPGQIEFVGTAIRVRRYGDHSWAGGGISLAAASLRPQRQAPSTQPAGGDDHYVRRRTGDGLVNRTGGGYHPPPG
jgi:quinol-cytochrome oxidoreductase complex cytochrome b subunit